VFECIQTPDTRIPNTRKMRKTGEDGPKKPVERDCRASRTKRTRVGRVGCRLEEREEGERSAEEIERPHVLWATDKAIKSSLHKKRSSVSLTKSVDSFVQGTQKEEVRR
jgi:hypothetical protein